MNPTIIGNATLYLGDCISTMAGMPDNSLDAVICDPPYLISFMGRSFDSQHKALPGANEGQKMQEWHRRWVTEAYRILKPGGHLAAFGGDRTHHRLMSAMEDVGFELRFNLYWAFGSGFPKSQDASKAVQAKIYTGSSSMQARRKVVMGDKYKPSDVFGCTGNGSERSMNCTRSSAPTISVELCDESKVWSGYGTALKPAVEPICVGRKPMIGTLAENLLTWGTGAMNLDACRVAIDESVDDSRLGGKGEWNIKRIPEGHTVSLPPITMSSSPLGRFPPHLLHDGSEIVKKCFPDRKGWSSQKHSEFNPYGGNSLNSSNTQRDGFHVGYNDDGSSSRFFPSLPYDEEDCATIFYCAKASKKDRDQGCELIDQNKYSHDGRLTEIENPYQRNQSVASNFHVSVKPTSLMRWICRLLTPKGGTLLDPFMGSGSTLKAAVLENFPCIGIEMDADYFAIAEARVAHVSPEIVEVKHERVQTANYQPSLF